MSLDTAPEGYKSLFGRRLFEMILYFGPEHHKSWLRRLVMLGSNPCTALERHR